MQYKQGSETVDMINTPYILVSRPLSSNEDPEGLIMAGTITIIFGPTIDICLIGNGNIAKIAGCLISILFYTFGIFVAYRYYQTGLRVFAWLNIITLIILGIAIVALFITGITNSNNILLSIYNGQYPNTMIKTRTGAFVCAFIYIPDFILNIIIVKFSFKLAKLIDAKISLTSQQI
ncbi:unnamed protein product [Rotaria sordida]|uniref:Uncharacterized protein n=1 Tax=Rotaria sordida TaxID=392033 RepID=A0A814XQ60_9BILA|nr:unnamed protein product [Rotaria sordida]CAF1496179.1 unnamed protein product [Rotaria sordida]